MNTVSEQILSAIDILVDNKVSQLQYDKTIRAKIYRVDNVNTGEYKVRYNGDIFSAFANDLTAKYKVDDWVYVTVPEGNFSDKKIIVGAVTNTSLTQNQLMNLQNSIFEVSPTFDKLYGGIYNAEDSYGVIAGAPPDSPNSYNYIYNGPDTFQSNGFHGLFQQYSNDYELIRIQASFLVQFHNLHRKGNYGLEVEFYTKDDSSVKYRLDVNNFNGDMYKFTVYSPQSIIIKAQKSYLTGLKSVKLFEEDFEYDRLMKDGLVTDEQNTTVPNIFVKDIAIQFVEQKDLSNTTYYLTIATPLGIAFTATTSQLELVGRIIYEGKDIMDSSAECIWFERDLSVMVGTDDYDAQAGFGWKKIGEGSKITVNRTDIGHDQRYKLVAIYKDVVLTAESHLYNHLNPYSYEIAQTSGDANTIRLQLVNNYNNEVLVGDWYLSQPDGYYEQIQTGTRVNAIDVQDYLKYSTMVFYCTVYNQAGQKLGTLEHTIISSESENDVTITYVGEDTFRYDANGDVTIENAEKERTLQVNLAWKEGYGTSYNVYWVMRDDNGLESQLPGDKNKAYNPNNSMIENLWVDNYNILHYNIGKKYKVNFNNNTVIVKIVTVGGETYLFRKEILFLKDGDQGTNGTTYIAAVRPCDSNGLKISGFYPLRYNNNSWSNMQLRCYVYKDGELINGLDKYNLTYKWTGVNVLVNGSTAVNNTGIDQFTITGANRLTNPTSKELEFYVKVQVTIDDDVNKSRKVDIYASYPIDVIIGSFSADNVNIDDIPSYIKYTSSGLNPSFYSNNIRFLYGGTDYSDRIVSLNEDILKIKTQQDKKYLDPATSFIFEDPRNNNGSNIGVLSMDIPSLPGQRLIHPIIMYLDTYGNEAINGWDGTALEVDPNKQYIFAPQVGAGQKDSANRFTGVIMGADSGQLINGRYKIGLYGYQSGVNTFGLMEDGTAFFGAKSGGGQIVIDGTTAKIYGGDGGDSSTGMTITLADSSDRTTSLKSTDAIKVGGGVFRVTYDGTIYAAVGKLGCNSSGYGGWTIKQNELYSGSGTTYVGLNSDSYDNQPYAIWAGSNTASYAPFSVTKKGELKATQADVSGKITATSGTIAGWIIERDKLSAPGGQVWLSTSEIHGITVSGSTISGGTVSGSTISGGTISGSAITGGSISIGNGNFSVSNTGILTCTGASIGGTITATGGKIGSWTIDNSGNLKGYNVTLNAITGQIQFSGTATGAWLPANGTLSVDQSSANPSQSVVYLYGDPSIRITAKQTISLEPGQEVYVKGVLHVGDSTTIDGSITCNGLSITTGTVDFSKANSQIGIKAQFA